ncbi:MAG: DUF6493 family protein, partial [Myxococcota bacterium]
ALKIVADLANRGVIVGEELLSRMGSVMLARQKGVVKRAAKLLARHGSADAAIGAAIDGLVHPAPDVQTVLLDVIDARMVGASDPEALRRRLAGQRELLAPSLRDRLPPGQASPGAPVDEGRRRAPAPFSEDRRLTPVEGIDAALAQVTHALENPLDTDGFELALDAMHRHRERLADWGQRCGPLRKHARRILRRDGLYDDGLRALTAYVALTWCNGELEEWPAPNDFGNVTYQFLVGRCRSLAARIARQDVRPLLSIATHRGGWIEPEVFSERIAAYAGAKVEPHDALLALMRVPSAARAQARRKLDAQGGVPRGLLELAEKPPAIQYTFSVGALYPGADPKWRRLWARVEPPAPKPKRSLELRRELHSFHECEGHGITWTRDVKRWRATATPDDLAGYYAHGAIRLAGFDFDSADNHAEPLRASLIAGSSFGVEGHWLLLLALASRGREAIDLGLDVAIEGIATARVSPQALGEVLGQLLPTGLLKGKRLATTLGTLAEASVLHRRTVLALLQRGLRGDPDASPRDVAALLSLLYELLVAEETTLTDPEARRWLENSTRGGRVAKLKKKLLEPQSV